MVACSDGGEMVEISMMLEVMKEGWFVMWSPRSSSSHNLNIQYVDSLRQNDFSPLSSAAKACRERC